MSAALDILDELRARGAEVQDLGDGRLAVRLGDVLDDDLRARIRAHKADLRRLSERYGLEPFEAMSLGEAAQAVEPFPPGAAVDAFERWVLPQGEGTA